MTTGLWLVVVASVGCYGFLFGLSAAFTFLRAPVGVEDGE
jgi:hypothetical protein